jgi:hypothetical protein
MNLMRARKIRKTSLEGEAFLVTDDCTFPDTGEHNDREGAGCCPLGGSRRLPLACR